MSWVSNSSPWKHRGGDGRYTKSSSCHEDNYGSHHFWKSWWNRRDKEEKEINLRCLQQWHCKKILDFYNWEGMEASSLECLRTFSLAFSWLLSRISCFLASLYFFPFDHCLCINKEKWCFEIIFIKISIILSSQHTVHSVNQPSSEIVHSWW